MPKTPRRPSKAKPRMTPEQQAFAAKFPGMTDDEVFETMAAVEARQKTIVAQGGTWEDEGLLWKSLYTEQEIIRRNPGKWMRAYHDWSTEKAKNAAPEEP